jgi:branched-chain amino acid aminotransferase
MTTSLHISLEKVAKSRISETDFDNLKFGKTFSDHMFVVDYANGGWGEAKIMPFQKLSFNPSMAVLHYGQSVFEGLKAFKNEAGEVLMFRPEEHAKRLNASAERLCMPTLPEEIFLEGLYALLELDKNWIPQKENSSLYIRPIMFSTDEALGVAPCKNYTFIIMTGPVSSYYDGDVKVVIEKEFVRAAEGGVGFTKTSGNYAASLYPALQAQKKGYDQLLWTDAKEHKYIEEAGTMNVMFEIDGKIITPMTTTSILSGITRKSIVDLAKKWGIQIEERRVSIDELQEAYKNGKLNDAFGTGTAATISHISVIALDGEEMILPAVEQRGFSNKAKDYLSKLKIGKAEDYMSWMKKL